MNYWRWHRFRLRRADVGRIQWWLDILLLDTLVRDCIASQGSSLTTWRVHRRAMDDEAGHQFSLLCYGNRIAQDAVDTVVRDSPALRFLEEHDLLRQYLPTDEGCALGALSDGHWPSELKESWPLYIQGVSGLLLALADGLRDAPRPLLPEVSLDECQAYYVDLMSRLRQVWHDWGSHAFLHHLNAAFGYEPIAVSIRFRDDSGVVF